MNQLLTAPQTRRGIRWYDLTAFHASIRPSDVFLCTYPKSGTTWLGFLIAQLLKASPDEPLDLKSFGNYVPDVNLRYTKRGSLTDFHTVADPRFFLCHAAYDAALPRVVYVIRDPRDTLLSYWHYQKFLHKDFDLSLADYLERGGHWPCDWDEHVESWLSPRRHPGLLVVRYEDLHRDTAGVLRSVLAHAGLHKSDEEVCAAIDASRFDRMREAEDRFGVHGKSDGTDERFVRKGRVGSWRDEMDERSLRIIQERYGSAMRLCGYAAYSETRK